MPDGVDIPDRVTRVEGEVVQLTLAMKDGFDAVNASIERTNESIKENNLVITGGIKSLASDIGAMRTESSKFRAESARQRAVSWPLVISVIVAAFIVSGAFLAFVNMKTKEMSKQMILITNSLSDRIEANQFLKPGYIETVRDVATLKEAVRQREFQDIRDQQTDLMRKLIDLHKKEM